ncbi:hypothetical protein [Planctomycetes bacterium TBK1r]|uniref:4Fe-4S ferredoxin-type domain-containing protein n=1 Tax=Stieleria magnilauensis TaxID=2527963 RepID=A0ABX5XZX9_9BACT|nr:hypothetical protein TBK1r_66080 [Planctomycetes bacterium TBK1r]
MSIQKNIQAALLLTAALCLLDCHSAFALGGKLLDQTGCACCPVCDHVCKLDAEQVEEEKTCFTVESKAICIPRVVFPWQKAKKAACASCTACDGLGCTACVHNGARVRKVCVLKTEKYKCPACEYTWTAEKKDRCGCCPGSCAGACGGGTGCDSGCAAAPLALQPSQASVLPAPVAEPAVDAPVELPVELPVDAADYYRSPSEALPTPPAAPPAPVAE